MSPRHRRRWGGVGVLVLASIEALASLACLPTVQLGRDDDGASSGASTEAPGSGTAATSTAGPNASATAHVEGGAMDTGQATGVDHDNGMGPGGPPGSTSGEASSDTGTAWCPVQETDNACLSCARRSCCAELELCAGQEPCNCFVDCLGTGAMPDTNACQMQCGGSSGISALQVCLAMACPGTCGTS